MNKNESCEVLVKVSELMVQMELIKNQNKYNRSSFSVLEVGIEEGARRAIDQLAKWIGFKEDSDE
jgi:hypothetical protein